MGNLLFRRRLALACGGLLLALPLAAQVTMPAERPEPVQRNVIKLAPLAWLHGQLPFSVESRIGYERVLGRRSSLMGSYSYVGTNPVLGFIASAALSGALSAAFLQHGRVGVVWLDTRVRTSGYRYQLQYRQYLGRKRAAPEGWYLAPHFSHAEGVYTISLKDFDVSTRLRFTNRNYNLLFGHQRVLGRHFTFDIFTGLGYKRNLIEIQSASGSNYERFSEPKGLKLSSGLNIGWAF